MPSYAITHQLFWLQFLGNLFVRTEVPTSLAFSLGQQNSRDSKVPVGILSWKENTLMCWAFWPWRKHYKEEEWVHGSPDVNDHPAALELHPLSWSYSKWKHTVEKGHKAVCHILGHSKDGRLYAFYFVPTKKKKQPFCLETTGCPILSLYFILCPLNSK